MWVLKVKLDANHQFFGQLAIKYNVSLIGYPVGHFEENKKLYVVLAGYSFGEQKDKDALFDFLEKSPVVKNIERNNDFAITIIEQPLVTRPCYHPHIIKINPIIVSPHGYHIWELACFQKKPLEEVLKVVTKYMSGTLIKFRQEPVKNITFTKLQPDLTDNQKKAMGIALKHGYYQYPKKTTLPYLAKQMNISYSTYQAHLKKAESKLLPQAYQSA